MKQNTNTKILFVSAYFPPHPGGMENYVLNIAKGLRNQYKWQIVVITSGKTKNISIENQDGMKIYLLPVWFTLSNTPVNPLWYFMIKKIIRKENPDVINAHAPLPFISDIAALVSGKIPFILTYHTGSMKKNKLLQDLLISFYESFILPLTGKRANKIICVSDFVKKTSMKDFSQKSVTIYPGIEEKIFKPSSTVKKEKTVLFIGHSANMYQSKGLRQLLETVTRIPQIKLNVIGEKITLRQINVYFLGIKTKPELVKEIQKASVVVLPALPDKENIGTVLLEAMACKTPVIATNTGGMKEVVRDGVDGLLVPPLDTQTLESAIRKMIFDSSFAQKLGLNGYKKIHEQFLWKNKVDQTFTLFDNYLSYEK